MKMQYMKMAGLDKIVSRIVLGTPGLPTHKVEEAFDILDDMYAMGINCFDGAHVYPNDGEGMVFRWAKERGIRENIVLISKCCHPNALRNRVTPYDIMSDISDTLAKEDADYVDIYMLHRDDERLPVGEVIDTMNDLCKQGKIKTFGASNWTAERVKAANDYAKAKGLMPFTSVSPNYGLAEQVGYPWGEGCVSITGEAKKEARQFYADNQMPIFCYSPIGGGIFSGRVKSDDMKQAKKILSEPSQIGYLSESNMERLRRAEILGRELGLTVAQVALTWLFNQDQNTLAIMGTMNTNHMRDNFAAINYELPKEKIKWLELQA